LATSSVGPAALRWGVVPVMQAVPAIQGARSVHKPLRLVGFEPAGLGWDVLLVMQAVTVIQDARSVHKPLRLVGFEPQS
jgi:hypothetical protein